MLIIFTVLFSCVIFLGSCYICWWQNTRQISFVLGTQDIYTQHKTFLCQAGLRLREDNSFGLVDLASHTKIGCFFAWKFFDRRDQKFVWGRSSKGSSLRLYCCLLFSRLQVTAENNDNNSTCHFKMTSVTNVVIKEWQEQTMTVILLEVKNLYHLWRKNKRFRHLVCHPWEMMMTDDRCGKKMLLRSVAKWQSHLPSRSFEEKGRW